MVMPSTKIIGLCLLLAGIAIAFWGYQMSGSVGSQLGSALSGSPADAVMYRYVGGGILAAIGAFLVFKK
jgi:hypothetical protein